MATNNGRGIPTIPSALMGSGPRPEADRPQAEAEEAVEQADEGRGDTRAAAAVAAAGGPKTRRRRPVAPIEKTAKRGVYLTDGVWDRLQYEAIRRKTTVSAICGDVLERHLPKFKVEREG